MAIDFANDRAWNAGALTPITTLLACTTTAFYYTEAAGTMGYYSGIFPYGTAGLVPEAAATNLVLRSQEFNNGAWSVAGVTVGTDAAAAPDGTTTAEKLTASSANIAHVIYDTFTLTAAIYSYSVYVKAAGYGFAFISAITNGFATRHGITVDLSSGAITQTNTLGSPSSVTTQVTALANGWYRVAVSMLATSVASGSSLLIGPSSTGTPSVDGSAQPTFLGDAASGIYVWGAQVELGSAASSYIPTTSATVTRAASVITFNDVTWLDGANDSLYVKHVARNINDGTLVALDATNDKLLREQTGMSMRIADATVANTAAAGATVKTAARLKVNDFAISMNGGTVVTDTSETAPGTLSAARIGCDLSGANFINGNILEVAAWKNLAIDNSGLVTLST
jgi:hypothetical protein